mmetsp:Transcript_69822/g.167623  ORF Transcript_69822/g.167623 Transcript_69822/m.167623 type:complete len:86 (-) Transcript_69822:51-308(-)
MEPASASPAHGFGSRRAVATGKHVGIVICVQTASSRAGKKRRLPPCALERQRITHREEALIMVGEDDNMEVMAFVAIRLSSILVP